MVAFVLTCRRKNTYATPLKPPSAQTTAPTSEPDSNGLRQEDQFYLRNRIITMRSTHLFELQSSPCHVLLLAPIRVLYPHCAKKQLTTFSYR